MTNPKCYLHGWEGVGGFGACPICAQIQATNRVAEAVEKQNGSSTNEIDWFNPIEVIGVMMTCALVLWTWANYGVFALIGIIFAIAATGSILIKKTS